MKKKNFIVLTVLFMFFCISSCIKASSDDIDVSVIVPIYNVEKYLDECLNSIENQTKTDGVEIICVNDGSKDKSAEILKNHADKNDKIKVITQENQGVSVARNEGMKVAKGKYIMFVDGDDLLIPYAIEKAFQTAEKYDVDVIKFNIQYFRDGTKIDMNKFTYNDSAVRLVQRKEEENPFKVWKGLKPFVWNKLYKRQFIEENNLTFKKGVSFSEDALFNWISIPKVYKMVFDSNKLYAYRTVRPGSAVNSKRSAIKNITNKLLRAEELSSRRNQIKFNNSDNWLSDLIINHGYSNICKLKDKNQKSIYAKKHLNIIDGFVKKYKIKLSNTNKSKVEKLRSFVINTSQKQRIKK